MRMQRALPRFGRYRKDSESARRPELQITPSPQVIAEPLWSASQEKASICSLAKIFLVQRVQASIPDLSFFGRTGRLPESPQAFQSTVSPGNCLIIPAKCGDLAWKVSRLCHVSSIRAEPFPLTSM